MSGGPQIPSHLPSPSPSFNELTQGTPGEGPGVPVTVWVAPSVLTILASLGQGQLRRKASTGRGGGPRTQPISLLLNMGSLSPQPLGLGRSAGPRAARLHDSPADENKEEDPAMPTGAGGNGRRKPHRAWSWELEHGRDTCASWVRAGRESLGVLRGLSLLPWTHPLQHGDPTPQPGGSPLVSSRMYQTVLTSSPAGADSAQAQSHHPRLTDQQSPGPSRPLSTPGLLRLPHQSRRGWAPGLEEQRGPHATRGSSKSVQCRKPTETSTKTSKSSSCTSETGPRIRWILAKGAPHQLIYFWR